MPHSAFISMGASEFRARAHPAALVSNVNKGAYETLVAHLPHDSELPANAIARKNEPLLIRYEYNELPGYEYIHCGAYWLYQILNLTRQEDWGWQIVFNQASQARPRNRYKKVCPDP